MTKQDLHQRIVKFASRAYPVMAVYAALVHVGAFFVIVSPVVLLPPFACLFIVELLLKFTGEAYRWQLQASPLVIRVVLFAYVAASMYWIYSETNGVSYRRRDGRYYAVAADRKLLGEVSREEFERYENRVVRFFSAALVLGYYLSAMTARRVSARSGPVPRR